MAEPKRKWVTDPVLLRQLNADDAPKRKWVTDPDLLRQLNASDASPAPAYDAMGNATGGVDAEPAVDMSYADQMRKVGGVLDDGARLLANGATFGMADRFAGGMDALTGQAPSYSEGVERQAGQTEDVRQSAPITSAVVEGIGGLAGGIGLMKNGVTLMGRGSQAFLPRAAKMGAEGAAYGAAHGAGNTYSGDAGDYAQAAGKGAIAGGVLGASLPAVGSLASTLYRYGQPLAAPAIDGLSRGASTLLRTAANADEAGIRALSGDTAMLVDAGPAMLGLGQGAGTGTGPGRSALVNALRERDAGTVERIGRGLDEAIGPSPVPSRVEAGLEASRGLVAEGYGPVMQGARATDLRPLADNLETLAVNLRGPSQRAVRDVRQMLDIPGNPGTLDPNPQALHATREAIDGLLASETNPQVIRQLTVARQQVDAALAQAAPGIKSVDAPMHELYRQSEGLQRGSQVFDTGKTAIRPVELVDELRAGALPQGEMVGPSAVPMRIRQGARAEVDRLQGTHVNDLATLERTLGTPQDWNSQKFGHVFGEEARDSVTGLLSRERRQRAAYQDIVQGSQTAQRTASGKAMDGGDGIPMDTTLTGAAAKMTGAGFKALMGLSRAKTKDDVGRALALTGDPARALGELLLLQRTATGETAQLLNRLLGAPEVISASTPALGRR